MKIIALGHYSRTGKDTLADSTASFASMANRDLKIEKTPCFWACKQATHRLYDWAGLREPEFYDTPEGGSLRSVVLPLLGLTPIQIWVKFQLALNDVHPGPLTQGAVERARARGLDAIIIPDVRRYREVDYLRSQGATLIKLVRPGYGPLNTEADQELLDYDGWDYIIGASGDLAELHWWARKLGSWIALDTYLEPQSEGEKALALEAESQSMPA